MAFEKVNHFFKEAGMEDRIKVLEQSSATVEQAAAALGCEPERIAKTMSFLLEDKAILIVTAGDAKIDNKKYKARFSQKARMIPGQLVENYIGHEPGGVCPFGIETKVEVYLDISLKRFEIVYPAAGNDHSAVELNLSELFEYSKAKEWIDVCSNWQEQKEF